ncbi:MAG TPA: hemerythrin domain-containing protein [Acidobacteriota bacterium]|jgi:hemerythrin-like domain-containing protein
MAELITHYMASDHQELDALGERFRVALQQGAPAALGLFEEFRQRFLHHVGMEEELLFPAFEAKHGRSGPTEQLRKDHQKARALLLKVGDQLARRAPAAHTLSSFEELTALVHQHNLREEAVLYPATDRLHGSEEASQLLQAMQARRIEEDQE